MLEYNDFSDCDNAVAEIAIGRHLGSLACRWNDGDPSTFEGAQFGDPLFDQAFLGTSDLGFLSDRWFEFQSDAREAASHLTLDLIAGSMRMRGDCQLFLVPIHGPIQHIEQCIASEPSFLQILRSFKEHGMVAPGASVLMSTFLLTPTALAETGPGSIRRALNHLVSVLLESVSKMTTGWSGVISSSDHERIACELLGGVYPTQNELDADTIVIGDRFLVGVRLNFVGFQELTGPRDYFTSFKASDEDETGFSVQAAQWSEELEGSMGDLALTIESPCGWDGAIHAAGANAIMTRVALDKDALGISEQRDADSIHLHKNDATGEIVVWFDYDGMVVGPVSVPLSIHGPNQDEFIEMLLSVSGCSKVYGHESTCDVPESTVSSMSAGRGM